MTDLIIMNPLNKIQLYECMDDVDFKIMIMRFRRIMSHLGVILGWGPGRQEYARRNIKINGNLITLQMLNYQGLNKIDDMHLILPTVNGKELIFIICDNDTSRDQQTIFSLIEENNYDKFRDDTELAQELEEFIEDYISEYHNLS